LDQAKHAKPQNTGRESASSGSCDSYLTPEMEINLSPTLPSAIHGYFDEVPPPEEKSIDTKEPTLWINDHCSRNISQFILPIRRFNNGC
jgi:hypothetical protein